MLKMMSAVTMVLALVSVSGCASMGDVTRAHAQGKGSGQVYETSEDRAWNAARETLHNEGADSVEEHRPEHYMLASFPSNGFTYGTVFGAWVEPVDPSHVRVTAISKRRYQLSFITNLTEGTFQREVGEAVAKAK